MKNQNIVVIAIASALAFALGPVTEANITPQGGPAIEPTANAPTATASTIPSAVEFPVITIHSAGNILRGKTGSFVLAKTPALTASGASGMYVHFKVSGTAVPGVDYIALTSPAYIGPSGYGVISVKTLANPRGSFNNQAYSVVVTLEPGPGYAVGTPSSAKLLISTSCVLEACW
jgi:hypothetical protein